MVAVRGRWPARREPTRREPTWPDLAWPDPARRELALRHLALAALAAGCLVLPLVTVLAWGGQRLAWTGDTAIETLSPLEQPLTTRSLVGVWALLLALAWFGLAYRAKMLAEAAKPQAGEEKGRRARRSTHTPPAPRSLSQGAGGMNTPALLWWEPLLVLVGSAAALARLGNAWLDALLLVAPLARQLAGLRLPSLALAGLAAGGLAIAGLAALTDQPPALPAAALAAARTQTPPGTTIFADWRWAATLQQAAPGAHVLGATGLRQTDPDYWLDYLRITQGHQRWAALLDQYGVQLVVLQTHTDQAAADLVRTSPDWQVLVETNGALVARRQPPGSDQPSGSAP